MKISNKSICENLEDYITVNTTLEEEDYQEKIEILIKKDSNNILKTEADLIPNLTSKFNEDVIKNEYLLTKKKAKLCVPLIATHDGDSITFYDCLQNRNEIDIHLENLNNIKEELIIHEHSIPIGDHYYSKNNSSYGNNAPKFIIRYNAEQIKLKFYVETLLQNEILKLINSHAKENMELRTFNGVVYLDYKCEPSLSHRIQEHVINLEEGITNEIYSIPHKYVKVYKIFESPNLILEAIMWANSNELKI